MRRHQPPFRGRSGSSDPAIDTRYNSFFAVASGCRGLPHRLGTHFDCMRVAIITESFPPDVNGVAHSVVRVAEHLVARGHEPLVIAPQPSSGARSVTGVFPYQIIRVPSVATPGYGSFRLGLPSRRLAAALKAHRTDLV